VYARKSGWKKIQIIMRGYHPNEWVGLVFACEWWLQPMLGLKTLHIMSAPTQAQARAHKHKNDAMLLVSYFCSFFSLLYVVD
jgi:hypothetical protein